MDKIQERAEQAKKFAIAEMIKRGATDADLEYLEENWMRFYGKITKRGGLEKPEDLAGNFIAFAINLELMFDDQF